jgi:hypothetical protein
MKLKKPRRLDRVAKLGDIRAYQRSETNEMHCLYSVYYELTACTCFEHYWLMFRRRCTNNIWYTACVLCRMVAASRHNTHAVYQMLFVRRLLEMSH